MSPVIAQFLTLLVPVFVGIITVPILTYIKKVSTLVNSLPDPIKQLIVLIITWALNELATLTGATLPTSLGGFDSTSVGTLVSACIAYLLHLASQASAIKATTSSTNTIVKATK